MKKRIIITTIIIAISVAAGWYLYSNTLKKSAVYNWRTATISRGDIRVTVTATGSTSALNTVQVGTQVSGTIAKLLADYNDIVRKGQIIAILDTTFLAATKEEAEANLERASVQVNQARREFNRTEKLFAESVIARAEYETQLTAWETAVSALRSARAQANRARINLQYATIRAPIQGVVISRNVDVGQTVIASFNSPTLFSIANDLTRMQLEANIDEADIGQIVEGQQVTFTVDAYPDKTFSGVIRQIRLQPAVVQMFPIKI